MAAEKKEYFEIASDANKVYKSDSPHLLALSALFTFPFVLFLLACPVLQYLQITNIHIPQFPSNQDSTSSTHVMFFFLYAFSLLTLYICATATITYSSYQVIFGRPVQFLHAIKSLSRSFVRLFATFFCVQVIIVVGLIGVGLIVFGIFKGFEYMGFQIEYSSKYSFVLKIILGSGLLYICVKWFLATVIVAVERFWGLQPLRRIAYLVKGGGVVVACLIFCLGLIMWLPAFGDCGLASFECIVMAIETHVLNSECLMLYLLFSLTTNTVIYVKCKALHGDLTLEVDEQEYVNIAFG